MKGPTNTVQPPAMGRLGQVQALQRWVLVVVSSLVAVLCLLATRTAASLPNSGWQDWALMAMFLPVFVVIAVCAWRRWGDIDVLGAVFFVLFSALLLLRIAVIIYGPIFATESLPVFMPVFAFIPLVYVSGALVSNARVALAGNTAFWAAMLLIVLPPLWPIAQGADANANERGAFQLMYWLLGANPVMIALLYLTQRIRGQLESAETEVSGLRERQQLLAALEESNMRFDLAIRGSADGMWDWFDVNKDAEWWSPRFYELIGHDPDALPASFSNFAALVHPDDKPAVEKAVAAHFEQGLPYRAEFRMRDAGGVYRWFVARGDSVRDADGKPVRMAGSLRDVHDRKLAEDELHHARDQLQSVLDYAPSLIYAKKRNGTYILANDRWRNVADPQASLDELLGKTDLQLFGAKNAEVFTAEDDQVAEAGQGLRFDSVVELDDRTMHFITDKFPLRDADGRIYAVGGISTDVTDLVNAQAELEASNADLERFSYIASHDLAAPLRGISGFAQLLRRKYGDELSEGAAEYLEQIEQGTKSMRRMIDALLELSRAGRDMEVQAVSLDGVVQEAQQRVAVLVDEASARIDVEPLPVVHGQHDQLVQVFQNLLQNAIKFRRPEEQLRVTISADTIGDQLCLRVADNGIGVQPGQAEHIFGIFQKLHHESEYAGQGIGLAICEKIVKAHGGSIALETPGEAHAEDSPKQPGATFLIKLPNPHVSRDRLLDHVST